MKIADSVPFAPTRRLQTTRKTGSATGFSQALGESSDAQETSATTCLAPVACLAPLMQLQEVSDALQGKSRACARAGDLLNILDGLREGLLVGSFFSQDLSQIAQKLSCRVQENIDPALQELLDQIEQRVHIELTKIEMSRTGHGF